MSAPVELDRGQLEALLAELDRRLAARGIAAAVYVVGGAAIALTTASRRVTVDVDAVATDAVVYEEAALLAMKIAALRDRDYPDIAALASLLGLGSAPTPVFEDLLRSAYRDDELLETVLGVRRDEDLDAEVSARAEAVRRIIDHFSE